MDAPFGYADLSLLAEKAIDVTHLINKIKGNGYSIVALDQHVADPKLIKAQKEKIAVEGVQVLRRITLVIENSSSLHPLGQQQCPYECDILAIKPLNEKMFHAICTEYESYDIITFDLANKIPFMLKRNPVYEAIRKGKFFEIIYEPLFDETKRTVAMTNIINIVKATGGKNLIVSSQASSNSTHRTPCDVASMLISLGLDKGKALSTMKQNCMAVIRNGQHRSYLKGAIRELPADLGLKLNKKIQKHGERLRKIRRQLKKQKQMEEEGK